MRNYADARARGRPRAVHVAPLVAGLWLIGDRRQQARPATATLAVRNARGRSCA